jgi:hypothetical protein
MTYEEFLAEYDQLMKLSSRKDRGEAMGVLISKVPQEFVNRHNQERYEKELFNWRDFQVVGETKEARKAKVLLSGHQLDESDERFTAALMPEAIAQEAEVWHFRSPPATWTQLAGREGFMILKGDKVLKTKLTRMN